MKTLMLSMMVMAVGCGGIRVRVLDPHATASGALAVNTLTIDRFTVKSAKHDRSPGLYETHLVADALRAGSTPLVEATAADYVLSGNVERASVDEWVTAGAGSVGASKVHFKYVHYEISLELKDKQGRPVARAKSEVDDLGKVQFENTLRATVRELMGALRKS